MVRKSPSSKRASFADLSVQELAEAITPHWGHLTRVLKQLGEADVHRLLCYELANRRNKAILVRLHQRWSRLRSERERAAMLDRWEVP